MIVNGLFKWQGYENTRIASVLGRIALSCFFAAIIYLNTSLRTQIIWFAGILLLYWAAMALVPVPGYGAGVLTPEGNLEAYIDRILLPGKLIGECTILKDCFPPFLQFVLLCWAFLQDSFLRRAQLPSIKKVLLLVASGIVLLLLGLLWSIVFR